MTSPGFHDYCRRKEEAALAAPLAGFTTLAEEAGGADLLSFGNAWTRRLFDGDFHRSAGPASPELPSVSLMVTESQPATFGATVPHLLHEGLTRVDADAVLGGIGEAGGGDQICSVWHPELVQAARRARAAAAPGAGARHQLVRRAVRSLPAVPRAVAAGDRRDAQQPGGHAPAPRLREYPWVEVLGAGDPLDLRAALTRLRDRGIAVVSAVGGRRVATSLLDAGLVTDLYITVREPASAASALSFYDGPPLVRRRLLSKAGRGAEGAHPLRAPRAAVGLRARTSARPGAVRRLALSRASHSTYHRLDDDSRTCPAMSGPRLGGT